jgi:hypothetical protein
MLTKSRLAYRINEPADVLAQQYEGTASNEQRLADFYDSQPADGNDGDDYYLIPCRAKFSHVLCSKMDRLSRRDTGFLRFGRKR